MQSLKDFTQLHHQETPLLLANIWDVDSALLFQKLGFKALGTSSAAVAEELGYKDGEEMPFSDLVSLVKEVQSKIEIPLTVDIEGGYSRDVSEIINHIKTLQKLGVVGVNLEDSIMVNGAREILDVTQFAETVRAIKTALVESNTDVFLNVRTDAYIMGLENAIEKTLKRIKAYEEAGANGIFVPCLTENEEIKAIVTSTTLPVNIMCMPTLPDFNTLENLGVKRISMGPFAYRNAANIEELTTVVLKDNSFKSFFSE